MRKITQNAVVIVAFAAMMSCLLLQAQTEPGFSPTSVQGNEMMIEPQSDGYSVLREPVDPRIEFERNLARFYELQQSPLTTANAEALLLGDIIWQRLAGESEFFLAPVITDFDAYYSRIKALDIKAEGINKSVFAFVKLPNDGRTKTVLATMNIHVPDYFTNADVLAYLPQIDIDHLQGSNIDVEHLTGYGKSPVSIKEHEGTRGTIYFQGWEGAVSGYTFTGGNTQWGKVSCQAYNGSWSMWCAGGGTLPQPQCTNYTISQNTSVQKTTGVNVANYANKIVSFRYKQKVEQNWDNFRWYYSSNGTSWTLADAFTGQSANWPNYSLHNIGLAIGWTTFYYMFEFTSDGSNNQEGAFVDNIEITGDQGCTSATQFPSSILTPEANWKYVNGIWAGEFSRFSVVSGTLYHWSLCPDHCGNSPIDSELSLRRFDNDQILAYANDVCGDDARIGWTANFTGDVKVVLTKFSCTSQSIGNTLAYKSGTLENASLSVTPSNRNVPYTATSTTFDIVSNASWSITGWPAWVTSVTPSSGTGNQTITVNYQQNNQGGPQRIATLNAFMPCGTPVDFTITQAPDPGCNSTSLFSTYNPQTYWRYITTIQGGQYAKFNVTQGQQYHWSLCPVQGGDASYDSQLTLRNDADDTFIAHADDYCGDDAFITWTATFTGVVKLIVSQYNCNTNTINTRLAFLRGTLVNPSLLISPTSRTVTAFEGSTTFDITSNTSWTLSGWPVWMTVNAASGSANQTMTVVYGTNSGNTGRTGTITISAPGVPNVVFTLTQGYYCNSATQYPPATTLIPENYWKHQDFIVAGEYSLHSVTLGQTYHWSLCAAHGGNASGYDSQLTLRKSSDNELLAYSDDNCGDDAMISWTATFTGNVKVVVSQYPCGSNTIPTCLAYRSGTLSNAVLSVSPANRDVTYLAGSTTFSITANGAWTIPGWPAWISSVSPSSGTGNATVTVNYNANNTGLPARQATLNANFSCGDPISFSVTQASDPGCINNTAYGGLRTPSANWEYVNGIFAGEYARFSVTTGTQYHFSLCPEHCGNASYDSELTLRRASDNLYIGYDNSSCGDDARITWTANFSGEVRVYVSQYPCSGNSSISRVAYKSGTLEASSLIVSPTNRPVSSASGSTTFGLSSNSTWTISGWPTWISSVSPASGSGNATITVNYDANATGSMRVGIINAALPCGGIVPFTVTQGEAGLTCPSYNFHREPNDVWNTHTSSHGPYASKIYRMTVYSGRTYVFKTGCGDGATADYDTKLTIYDQSCAIILEDDDGCSDFQSILTWTAPYTGYAYLEVSGLIGDFYGTYTLAYRHEGCNMDGVLYVSGITPNQNWNYINAMFAGEYATFNVVSGTQYHWSLCPEHCADAPYDSELTLKNAADNTYIAFSNNACNLDARISWTATFTGVVKVLLTQYPCSSSYTFTRLAYKSGALNNASISITSNSNVNYEAGSVTYNITSNASWTISNWPAWVNSVTPSTGNGNQTITVSYNANTTGSIRVGNIEVTLLHCGTSQGTTLTQGEQPKECPDNHFARTPSTSYATSSSSFGPGANKIYRMSVTNGNKYTFKTGCGDGATAEFDTELFLYDNNCNQVAYDDDGCESVRSVIEWNATYTGYAYLLVRGFDYWVGSYGDYTLAYIRCVLPAQPGAISGNTSPCQGSQQTYSVSPVSGASSYSWTLPAGWGGSSTSNVIVATAGTSGGNITVVANNDCGTGPVRTLAVTVSSIPAQPGAITGPATVCNGTSHTYSVSAVPGATAYTWSLPAGWSGSSTTNSINVTAGASGGLISVTASNACGTSPASTLTVNVISIPVQPGPITGLTTVVVGSTNAYSISAVSGATSYSWSFSGAGSISGSGTNINLTANSTGTLSVTANNTCGSSQARTLEITATSAYPSTLALQDVTITPDASPICYGATQTITLAGGGTYFVVQNNADVELVAGINIIMLPGTQVEYGGSMLARITQTSDYCVMTRSIVNNTSGETIIREEILTNQHSQLFCVFPNPTTGLFTLELFEFEESSTITVEVYGMLGDRILHTTLPVEQYYLLDLSGKQTGMYFIKVMIEGRVGIEKLLKK